MILRLKIHSALIFGLLRSLFFGSQVISETISPEEGKRLEVFLRRAAGVPPEVNIEVRGFEKAPIEGFKKATFVVATPGGTREIPFYLTQDDRYIIIGDLIDTKVNPLEENMKKMSLKDEPTMGASEAKIIIVEYSDFQCPYCKSAAVEVAPKILKEYEGKVKLVYKHFPLDNVHPWAREAAVASECAFEQGNERFWKFHDLVFEKQEELTKDNAKEKFEVFAKDLGLNTDKFKTCFDSPATAQKVSKDVSEAKSLGVSSTPTFFVNGFLVRGGASYERIKATIDAHLTGKL